MSDETFIGGKEGTSTPTRSSTLVARFACSFQRFPTIIGPHPNHTTPTVGLADTTLDYATKADTDLLCRDLDGVEQRLNAQILRSERAIGSLYTHMNQRFDAVDERFNELKELILRVESKVDDRG